mmetsp:Transcript_46964/g.123699  ORF Transcript_46964/g.123699 Transcript_46964/m.123699 type:complete len:84 (+) Transcript_46964:302-553(+)|eukprot:1304979-Prymnesium_polylepis.1
MPGKGVYHYKCKAGSSGWSATGFGEMAEELPGCEGATMMDLEKAMVAACTEVSGLPCADFGFTCDMVTPDAALFTACIDTAMK